MKNLREYVERACCLRMYRKKKYFYQTRINVKKKKVELLNLQLGVVTCFISSQGTEDKKIILASCLCFPDMINIFHFIILCN